jgi:hypothetical protein
VSGQETQGYLGGLAAVNAGMIASSSATGNVTSTADETLTGGFVGFNLGTIQNAYATGTVSAGDGNTIEIGGFAGENHGSITAAYSTGNVTAGTGNSTAVGGFAGVNDSGATILIAYSTGATSSGADVGALGGFVGRNDGATDQSYAMGAVTATGTNLYVGGMAGQGSGTMDQDYTISAINTSAATTPTVGGFIGADFASSGSITNSEWDTSTTGITDPTAGAGNVTGDSGISNVTTAQLKSALPANWDTNVWGLSSKINGGLPYLIALKSSY